MDVLMYKLLSNIDNLKENDKVIIKDTNSNTCHVLTVVKIFKTTFKIENNRCTLYPTITTRFRDIEIETIDTRLYELHEFKNILSKGNYRILRRS